MCQIEVRRVASSFVARGNEQNMLYACIIVLLNAHLGVHGELVTFPVDESKCTVHVSRMQSYYLPYTETYRSFFFQTRTRINYRIDYKQVRVEDVVCCPGYKGTRNNCEPICTEPCINGRCVKPETCSCDHGYIPYNASVSNNMCVAVCDVPCVNGYCPVSDRCECNDGYQLSEEGLNCQPVCGQNCQEHHARCAEPNKCLCDTGYQSNNATEDGTLCTPICEVPCVNGECTAPDVCTCNDGYEAGTGNVFTCEPKCEQACRFGRCTAPNICTCNPGYRMNEANVCEPICSHPCVMGTCIAPEACGCNDGYGLSDTSFYACEPICEKACVNGTCTAPGVCVCHEGYWFNGSEEEERICKPFCKIPCYPYGECVAPYTCSCFEGYRVDTIAKEIQSIAGEQMYANTTGRLISACVPICNESCVNGECVQPNVCQCNPGYQSLFNDSNICEPVCDAPCGPNGVCTEPNHCTCSQGYKPAENDVRNVCEPICEVHCGPNGTCTAPNVCTCDVGYERDAEDRCEPSCSSCYNGTCVAPNVCQCQEGFILTNGTVCSPFCRNNCENGECVAPDECRCNDGFEMNGNNSGCVEPCTKVCKGHGVCVGDEQPCDCSYGWAGWDCDQATVCILLMDADDKSLEGLTVHNETNSTLMDARHYAPYCHPCNETAGNESFCFTVTSDDGSRTIGCLVETESPCYSTYRNNTAAVSTMAGVLSAVTILIIAVLTAATYVALRRHRRRKMRAVIIQNAMFQGTIANESLLTEEDSFHH